MANDDDGIHQRQAHAPAADGLDGTATHGRAGAPAGAAVAGEPGGGRREMIKLVGGVEEEIRWPSHGKVSAVAGDVGKSGGMPLAVAQGHDPQVMRSNQPSPSPGHTLLAPRHQELLLTQGWSPPDPRAFKDILIFEERLKQNAERLAKRRKKYEAFLTTLVMIIVVLTERVLRSSTYEYLHYLHVTSLMISLTTLALFFASGMYTERILYAKRFIPQCNRALRSFNLHLNMKIAKTPSRFESWISRLLAARHRPRSLLRTTSQVGEKRGISPSRSTNFQSIAPTTNPRGAIVMGSRIPAHFREGYERYRATFERRRQERIKLKRKGKELSTARQPSSSSSPAADGTLAGPNGRNTAPAVQASSLSAR